MTLVEGARALAAGLPAHRATHDGARCLDPTVIGALRDGGFLSCLLPRELGGGELAPAMFVEVLEALAIGDSATAWCTMTAATSTVLAAYLPRAVATAMWTNASPFFAGVFAPTGKLTAEHRLTGRWSYTSGCRHADWFVVGALAERGGRPRHVVCFVPRAAAQIIDNWDTLGLGGTGSHDVAVDDVAIPVDHVTSVFDQTPWTDAPLYRVPMFGLLAAGIAACGLGIARGALAHAATKLTGDVPSPALVRYAELRARLDAARAYLLATCTAAFTRAQAGAVDPAARGELRLTASFVAAQCAEVVRAAFHLGGGASVRAGSPLNAAVRDIETLLTHRMVADRVLAAAARAMLGIGSVPPDL